MVKFIVASLVWTVKVDFALIVGHGAVSTVEGMLLLAYIERIQNFMVVAMALP